MRSVQLNIFCSLRKSAEILLKAIRAMLPHLRILLGFVGKILKTKMFRNEIDSDSKFKNSGSVVKTPPFPNCMRG